MQRLLLGELEKWSRDEFRKPLVLEGARQVGKTWLLKEFARSFYRNFAYVAMDESPEIWDAFRRPFNLDRLVSAIQTLTHEEIAPGRTLVILDEIQACPDAITLLKYWQEEAPEYHVAVAGSLLGLANLTGSGFPVGKTNFLTLHPMNFQEFLLAMGEEMLWRQVESGNFEILNAFPGRFRELLKTYYVVGGMPEAVAIYSKTLSLDRARQCHQEIMQGYSLDIARHVPESILGQVKEIFNSVPLQLARPDKRFVAARAVPDGSSKNASRKIRPALDWLEEAALVRRVYNVRRPGLPLEGYRNHLFKLFSLDVGLLATQSGLDPETVLHGNSVFTEFKGALTEQFVAQELVSAGYRPYTWLPPSSESEIDFLVSDRHGRIIPMEVKAERNLKAKSLAIYREKFRPEVSLRTSLSSGSLESGLLDIPLYAISRFEKYLPS